MEDDKNEQQPIVDESNGQSNDSDSCVQKNSKLILGILIALAIIAVTTGVLLIILYLSKDDDKPEEEDDDDGKYLYETNPGLTSSFGCEGDIYAPIAYIDGSYLLRDRSNMMITFGVTGIKDKVKWYNKEGYLPCFVSEITKKKMKYTIENFSFEHVINNNKYEIAYSRITVTNNGQKKRNLPIVSSNLIPINDAAKNKFTIAPGETVARDYAIGADRFAGGYGYPSDGDIEKQGSFDENYEAMKKYWNERLAPLAVIEEIPNQELINAYKAGFIYTHIIRDDYPQPDGTIRREIHVGENGYKGMFDHDTIGIVSALFTIGDFTYAKDYLRGLPAQLQYDDAKWKFSYPFAVYLQKTGDFDFIEEVFSHIMESTHKIETDRDFDMGGIIKRTSTIDSNGYWLVDDWSALAGLVTYKHICDQLYAKTQNETYKNESIWSQDLYDDLLNATEIKQKEVRDKNKYPYISIDMTTTTEQSSRGDPKDGNWASMFLFGRWAWDGYLFGGHQNSSQMINLIDDTYAHGFERRKKYGEEHQDPNVGDTIYNFGGYPHGYYSSAYNAGYGCTALRGEIYRDHGIKSYEFMLNKSMSGPFGWWEGVNWPNKDSPWDIDHAQGGGGSCQHMWGQSFGLKAIFDSLIAEKVDEAVIIGRGIPIEWIVDGKKIAVKNYSVDFGKKTGYTMERSGNKITIEFSGDKLSKPYSIELMALKMNIHSVKVDDTKEPDFIDYDMGIIVVAPGSKKVVIETEK